MARPTGEPSPIWRMGCSGTGSAPCYDASTIGILWFAGASAMAGLLNIVPRYLPRYGMAPDWARSTRPLVVVLAVIAAIVTVAFGASVDSQAGAYATGVLALMTSAAIAVFLTERRRGHHRAAAFFAVVSAIFVYTFAVTIIDRPEGLVIAGLFIAMIVVISVWSRITRSTELRVQRVTYDETPKRSSSRPPQPGTGAVHRQQAPGRRRARVPHQAEHHPHEKPHALSGSDLPRGRDQ